MGTTSNDTALLVMDVQPNILNRIENKDDYLTLAKTAIDSAHESKTPVIFVVVGFREGLPEVSPENQSFGKIKESGMASGMINPTPAIEPIGSDVVVTKRRVSAFTGSDLEVVLRAQGIRHLVLTGISTSGVVLSTIREASDKDFRLSVLSDLCADFDEQVNTTLMEKVFPRQATVMTTKDWISSNGPKESKK
jgi:nicotinamidase-related amidase